MMRFPLILVSPARPENIGAAARAMKTMGFSELRIVASDAWQDPAARRVAHGAGEILDNLRTCATLQEALADIDFSVATTARSRAKFRYYATPQQVETQLLEKRQWVNSMALVFGREDSGLTNEELQLCHLAVHIPSNPEFSSLNLAAAVQVLAYELRMASLGGVEAAAPADPEHREQPASHAQVEGLFGQLGQTLDEIDFHKGRAPDSAMRKLRRLFLRTELSEQEVRLLRGILADAQRMARLANARPE